MIKVSDVRIPLTVHEHAQALYKENFLTATHNTGRLFLFAADQKIEHLNQDFYGKGIPEDVANPKHLFEIASSARIGAFATNFGLIARYGALYKNIRYVVKLNGKTNLVPTAQSDPMSTNLVSVEQVAAFKERTGINIVGVGMTVYLGSEHEGVMLAAASQMVIQAHERGLLVIIWIYPRGKAVTHERHADIIAGAAGVAAALGADFVKVNPPEAADGFQSAQALKQATVAAGNTGVICSGGSLKEEKPFLSDLYHQIHTGGAAGAAVGRNVFQRSLPDAIAICSKIASIVIDDVEVHAD